MKRFVWVALLTASLPVIHGCAAALVGGAATAAVVATDRRKPGVFLEDQEIELRALDRLRGAFPGKAVSLSTVSFNHHVLLVGQVPDEAARNQAAEIVRGIPNVSKVYNETTVSGVTSYTSDANDATITSKVKARLLENKNVAANHVKVYTEAAVVYLMGLVTREEGNAAGDVAATTSGAVKVVKLFEYID